MSDLRRVLGAIRADRSWVVLGVGLAILAVLCGVALTGLSAYLVSRAPSVENVAELALAITAVRVLAIGRAAFRYLERYTTHVATFRILTGLRVWFYRAIEPLAPAALIDRRGGELLARIVGDIEVMQDLLIRVVVPALTALTVGILVVVALASVAPPVAAVLAIGLVLAGVVIPDLVRRASWTPAAARVARRADLGAAVVDGVAGRAELVAFGAVGDHDARVRTIGEGWDALGVRLARTRAWQAGTDALVIGAASLAALGIGIALVGDGRLDVVLLAAMPLVVIATFEVTAPLATAAQRLAGARAAAHRLVELVDTPPAVCDPATPGPLPDGHDLEIRGLRVRYAPDGPWVLDGLDLSIPAGGTVAIVGASGAGKSTLVDVLARFWDYEAGSIRLGGTELHDLAGDDVRDLLSIAAQHPDLFDASLRDNLALADADVSDARVGAVLAAVGLDTLVRGLPGGVHTRIGEDGIRLSGGEAQRLAIARALLREAPILVLDEATAHLDPRSEAALLAAIAPWRAGRTTILISHRRSVADAADRVVELVRGRAVTSGPARDAVDRDAGAR